MFGIRRRKTITREDVVWCFAHLLGRHPHTPAELNLVHASCDDFRGLVRKIVALPEFATRRAVASEWFAYDDSEGVQRQVLGILARLRPMRPVGRGKLRLGQDRDGGYVMLDDFGGITAAYSIGICDDVSWDLEMAQRDIDVFQYDHTIDGLPGQHPRFHWEKKGLGAASSGEFETLPRLIERNGHRGRNDLVLKCDIEGCEWEVLAALPDDCLRQFKQIVIEVHFLERLTDPTFAALVERAVMNLTADHRVVHVHANNHRPYSILGGIPVPSVLELTLARAADTRLEPGDETFPTSLDTPCYAGRADFRLGTFRF